MEINVLKDQFSKHLNKLLPALKKSYENEELNINDKIVFDITDDQLLNIYAKNEETSVKVVMKIVGNEGKKTFLVDGKKMISLVNKLEDKNFYMRYNEEDSILEFKQDGDIFLSTKPAETFKSLDDIFKESKVIARYSLEKFINIFNFSKLFTSDDNNFGFVELRDNNIITGSDAWIGFCSNDDFGGYFKIPVHVLSGFLKYLSLMDGEEVFLHESENWYFIKDYNDSYMAIRKVDGEVPDFNSVIKSLEVKDTIHVNREQLIKVIDRLSVPLERSHKMSFALLGDNILQISSRNISEKVCKEPIRIERNLNSDIIFSVNFSRLMKILSYFSEGMVTLDVYENMIGVYEVESGVRSFITFMQED